MIQINILQEAGSGYGVHSRSDASSHHAKKPLLIGLLSVVLVLCLGYAYLMFAGVPGALAPYLPEPVVASLGLVPPTTAPLATPAEPGTPAPTVVATAKPVVPAGNSVEDVVKTVRPDMFYAKERKEYRQLLPAEKILHQKMVMAAAFATFRAITPAAFGFTDLSFKIPDYFYARGLSPDTKTLRSFLDSLRRHSIEFNEVPPPEGSKTLEFTAYGRLNIPEKVVGERLALLTPSQVVQEMTSLDQLARNFQINFTGLDNPKVSEHGLYRRVLYRAQTKADFPAMHQFADALRASSLRVGVLQVSIRPSTNEGSVTVFDFVVYTSPK